MDNDLRADAASISPPPMKVGGFQWLGAVICVLYGFAKLNGSQFTVLDSELSKPLGEVSGFWLTWYYFGYSKFYGNLIALLQIGAGILLVRPRWSLVGALLLLPIVANIVLVDLFYGIDLGGIGAALILFGCVMATIKPHAVRLLAATVPLPSMEASRWTRIISVAMLLVGAYGFTWWVANYNNRSPTPIDGSWHSPLQATSARPATQWTNVFFEYNRATMVVFRSHDGHDETHNFELDSNRTLRIWKTWRTHDSLIMSGRWIANDSIVLTGVGDGERDTLVLRRTHSER